MRGWWGRAGRAGRGLTDARALAFFKRLHLLMMPHITRSARVAVASVAVWDSDCFLFGGLSGIEILERRGRRM